LPNLILLTLVNYGTIGILFTKLVFLNKALCFSIAVIYFLTKKVEKEIVKILKNGGVGILPTDTLYGLVGSALSKKAVRRIYQVRQRNPRKPLIILISSLADLKLFNIKINSKTKNQLLRFWPGKMSIILPCRGKKFIYLHRGTKTLAFRLIAKKDLVNLIKKVGPLVAPSANLEGMPPAETISQAKKYFGPEQSRRINFYINGGRLAGPASTLIQIKNNSILVKRKGAAQKL